MEEKPQRKFLGIWIPAGVWLDNKLSIIEKCLLAEIDSLDNDDEKGCIASNLYLANFLGTKEGSLANIISSLKKRRYLIQVYFDGRVRGLRVHSEMKAAFTKYVKGSFKNESSVNKKMRSESIKKLNQPSQIGVSIYNVENKDNSKDDNKDYLGEETPTPQIENDFVVFEVVEEKWKFEFDDDVPFSGNGMVDFMKWQLEKEKAEIENKANNLPLEEKKEKEKKVAPKKEKETKPVLKTMAEAYPNEADFVTAWGLRFGAKYPNVDASKGYNRILLYCESSGKKYADYVRVLLVWYTGEAEAKKQQYHYDKATKQSENYLDKLFYDIQNADPNIV